MEEEISNLRDTIIPKSDQLNADDLVGITRVIRVIAVKRGTKEQPVIIEFLGMEGRPYKPSKSMRKILIQLWGEDGREWIGKSIKLYNDPETKFGGVKVGGIKISQLSHIDKMYKLMITVSRGKKEEVTITRLPNYPQETFDANKAAWLTALTTGKLNLETLLEKTSITGVLTDEQISQLQKEIS